MLDLFEARDPEVEYQEKKAKGEITQVLANLQGKQSASFTRLAKKFKILDIEIKSLEKERKEINQAIKDQAEALFDAEDKYLTRVVETASMTINLSKAVSDEKVEFDQDKYIEALESILTPELIEKAKELRESFTTVKKAQETTPRLRVKLKDCVVYEEQENIKDKIKGLFKKIKAFSVRTLYNILRWSENYDKKLQTLSKNLYYDIQTNMTRDVETESKTQ